MSKYSFRYLSLLSAVWVVLASSPLDAQDAIPPNSPAGEDRIEIRLPDDPDAVVLRLDIRYPDLVTGSFEPEQGAETVVAQQGSSGSPPRVANRPVDPFGTDSTKSGTGADDGDSKTDTTNQETTDAGQAGGGEAQTPPPAGLNPPTNSENKSDTNQKPGPTLVAPVQVPVRKFVSVSMEDPVIEVYADGRVVCGRLAASARQASSRIDRSQVQQLLETIVNEHRFFELDAEQIHRDIESDPSINERVERRVPEFTITVTASGQQKALSVVGLRTFAGLLPNLEQLQNAAAIERMLNNLFMTINVGGRENMVAILDLVNANFDAQFKTRPDSITPFGIDDATFMAIKDDDNLKVVFGKRGVDENQRSYRFVAVLTKTDGNSNVTIYGYR